jgi:hypothetical protein
MPRRTTRRRHARRAAGRLLQRTEPDATSGAVTSDPTVAGPDDVSPTRSRARRNDISSHGGGERPAGRRLGLGAAAAGHRAGDLGRGGWPRQWIWCSSWPVTACQAGAAPDSPALANLQSAAGRREFLCRWSSRSRRLPPAQSAVTLNRAAAAHNVPS